MSATDKIRALLDKRGVEWFESATREGLTWIYRDGKAIRFHPWQPDTLKVSMFDLTPAQAVAATLGSEREQELESLAADMFNWLADYITPEQYVMWEARLEELDVEPTWRWTR